ncbi:MAG: UDP-N-acetylmuramate--L-alanine ligase, partial [Gemmatimonadota bacterium]
MALTVAVAPQVGVTVGTEAEGHLASAATRQLPRLFRRYRRIHLVGAGGAGMEGLARILVQLGCRVSGTDRSDSRALELLAREGVEVRTGHDAGAVTGVDLVVYSAAIPADNPERRRAAELGIPAVSRAEMLGELLAPYYTVAVAGTHGKTTTSSLIAAILGAAGLSPSTLIGGWRAGRPQAGLGEGDLFVVEADEYARSFLRLRPQLAVVTNVDDDHLDCYGSAEAVGAAFAAFVERLPFYGWAILNADDPGAQSLQGRSPAPVLLFGCGDGAEVRGSEVELDGQGSTFAVGVGGRPLGRVRLALPGRHNVSNALAAIAACHCLEVDFAAAAAALAAFEGVERRFQVRGTLAGDILVVEDYAHHPTEVAAA